MRRYSVLPLVGCLFFIGLSTVVNGEMEEPFDEEVSLTGDDEMPLAEFSTGATGSMEDAATGAGPPESVPQDTFSALVTATFEGTFDDNKSYDKLRDFLADQIDGEGVTVIKKSMTFMSGSIKAEFKVELELSESASDIIAVSEKLKITGEAPDGFGVPVVDVVEVLKGYPDEVKFTKESPKKEEAQKGSLDEVETVFKIDPPKEDTTNVSYINFVCGANGITSKEFHEKTELTEALKVLLAEERYSNTDLSNVNVLEVRPANEEDPSLDKVKITTRIYFEGKEGDAQVQNVSERLLAATAQDSFSSDFMNILQLEGGVYEENSKALTFTGCESQVVRADFTTSEEEAKTDAGDKSTEATGPTGGVASETGEVDGEDILPELDISFTDDFATGDEDDAVTGPAGDGSTNDNVWNLPDEETDVPSEGYTTLRINLIFSGVSLSLLQGRTSEIGEMVVNTCESGGATCSAEVEAVAPVQDHAEYIAAPENNYGLVKENDGSALSFLELLDKEAVIPGQRIVDERRYLSFRETHQQILQMRKSDENSVVENAAKPDEETSNSADSSSVEETSNGADSSSVEETPNGADSSSDSSTENGGKSEGEGPVKVRVKIVILTESLEKLRQDLSRGDMGKEAVLVGACLEGEGCTVVTEQRAMEVGEATINPLGKGNGSQLSASLPLFLLCVGSLFVIS